MSFVEDGAGARLGAVGVVAGVVGEDGDAQELRHLVLGGRGHERDEAAPARVRHAVPHSALLRREEAREVCVVCRVCGSTSAD